MLRVRSSGHHHVSKLSPTVMLSTCLSAFLSVCAFASAPQNPGAWEAAFNHNLNASATWNAIHMALIPVGKWQGRVMMIGGRSGTSQLWTVFDPETKTFENTFSFALPVLPGQTEAVGDIFCSGHTWLPDGRLFIAGGVNQYNANGQAGRVTGTTLVYLWTPPIVGSPGNGTWTQAPDLLTPRYYPTCTFTHGYLTHANESGPLDYVLVLGGTQDTGTPAAQLADENSYEVYRIPTTGTPSRYLTALPNYAGLTTPTFPTYSNLGVYPRTHYVSSKHVGYAAAGGWSPQGGLFPASWRTARIDHDAWVNASTPPGNITWTDLGAGATVPLHYCTTVLAPNVNTSWLDTILVFGGGVPAVATAFRFKASASGSGAWPTGYDPGALPSMGYERVFVNAVLLPDANVLVLHEHLDPGSAPYPPELLTNLATIPAWVEMAAEETHRGYHATSLLLPDGKVLSAGGNSRTIDYQVFQPPYLTSGEDRPVWAAPFPSVTWSYNQTGMMAYNEQFANGDQVSKIVLMRPGSVTHHHDADQRYFQCHITASSESSITFNTPPDRFTVPRGWYMLFMVSTNGIPSVARWVNLQ